MAIDIRQLDPSLLEDYKKIRLEALQMSPESWSNDYEEEVVQRDDYHWLRLQVGPVYGLYVGGHIAGMTGMITYREKNIRHKAALWGVYVTPGQRGQGYARMMLEEVFARIPAGIRQVTLGVSTENEKAIELYKSFGFEQYGIERAAFQKNDRFIDEALMVKVL